MKHNELIVGVDGSAASHAALRWATAEAARRGASVRVITAYQPRMLPTSYGIADPRDNTAETYAQRIVDEAIAAAKAAAPAVRVIGFPVPGNPARILLEAAGAESLVVLGSRSHNGFTATLLGSVSQQVATHAAVPVAIVRGRADSTVGPVVAGIDSSPASETVLELAFEQAATRGCSLAVVTGVTPPVPPWGAGDIPPIPFTPEAVAAEHRQELEQQTLPWVQKYPDVPLELHVGFGDAAKVLVGLSRGARLMVVGSRGHGGFTGLLLGSVGLRLLHHADCPVLIARGAGHHDT